MQQEENKPHENLTDLLAEDPTLKDEQIETLQKKLDEERFGIMQKMERWNHV